VPESAASGAPSDAAPEAPSHSFKGRRYALEVQDLRSDLRESQQLKASTTQLVTDSLKERGATISREEPSRLLVQILQFESRDIGRTKEGCVRLAARVVKRGQEFLPSEFVAARCSQQNTEVQQGFGVPEVTLAVAAVESLSKLSQVQENASLAKAYAVTLEEILHRLERTAP
jgi:hypothetical protein